MSVACCRGPYRHTNKFTIIHFLMMEMFQKDLFTSIHFAKILCMQSWGFRIKRCQKLIKLLIDNIWVSAHKRHCYYYTWNRKSARSMLLIPGDRAPTTEFCILQLLLHADFTRCIPHVMMVSTWLSNTKCIIICHGINA